MMPFEIENLIRDNTFNNNQIVANLSFQSLVKIGSKEGFRVNYNLLNGIVHRLLLISSSESFSQMQMWKWGLSRFYNYHNHR